MFENAVKRTFKLDRHKDLSGNSGTGIVAEGVEFSDGTVAMRWLTDTATTTFYDSIADVQQLHHHAGATEVVFDTNARKPIISDLEDVALDLTLDSLYQEALENHADVWEKAYVNFPDHNHAQAFEAAKQITDQLALNYDLTLVEYLILYDKVFAGLT